MKTTLLAIALISLVGCTRATQAPTTVVDNRERDLNAIKEVEQASGKAWAAKDVNAIAANYASNGSMIVPNAPIATGPEQIRGMMTEFFKDPAVKLEFEVTGTEVAGDLGYQRGNYTLHVTDGKTKKPLTEKGTYLTIYKKQADGSWKIVEDINAPGPAPQ
jgi:uncharacterized protein (TIGR02246 family)